jgi:hypothetical protein
MDMSAKKVAFSDVVMDNIHSHQKERVMPYQQATYQEISSVLGYDPATGVIWWTAKAASKIMVGMEAGSVKATRKNADGKEVAYRYIRVGKHSYPAQRLAWLLHHGEWPTGKVSFKDGDTLNLKASNLEVGNAIVREFDHDDPEGRAAYNKEYRENFPMFWKDSHLRSKFDISLADYTMLAVAQDNKCALCGNPETDTRNGKVKALAVDHDHVTGKIRGLLCVSCNTGLGKFKDDRDLLLAAVKYLDKHSGRDPAVTLTVVASEEPK